MGKEIQEDYVEITTFRKSQRIYLKIKRILDVVIAMILLLPAGVIVGAAAVWVVTESKGPVIFSQRRPGYHKKVFSIYKIRSMRVETTSSEGKPLTDRQRLTKSGEFIRKTSIDELPQILNVLKGEMSFIGPRPQLINDLPTFTKEQMCRFDVLPGITSLPGVRGRNNQDLKTKYDLDTYYVRNIGFRMDCMIFFQTIIQVFSQKDTEDEINPVIPAAEIMTDKK